VVSWPDPWHSYPASAHGGNQESFDQPAAASASDHAGLDHRGDLSSSSAVSLSIAALFGRKLRHVGRSWSMLPNWDIRERNPTGVGAVSHLHLKDGLRRGKLTLPRGGDQSYRAPAPFKKVRDLALPVIESSPAGGGGARRLGPLRKATFPRARPEALRPSKGTSRCQLSSAPLQGAQLEFQGGQLE
jgi:hypothetical protein